MMNFPYLEVVISALALFIVAIVGFFWRLPGTLKELSRVLKEIDLKTELHEKRLDASDQIFSDLAERGVNTESIAKGFEPRPQFPWKRRMEP